MEEKYIKLLLTTQEFDGDRNPIFPLTLGRAVYIDINGSTFDLLTAISLGLFYLNLINETVTINKVTKEISIPNDMEVIDSRLLLVFLNGILLNTPDNYTLESDVIQLVGYNTRIGDIFTFLYFPYTTIESDSGTTYPVATTIGSTSTDDQVPTARAVYAFVTNYINSLVNSAY